MKLRLFGICSGAFFHMLVPPTLESGYASGSVV